MAQVTIRLAEAIETSLVTLYRKALDARLKMSPKIAPNAAARAQHFDDWTSKFLAKHQRATVVHLGAVLDTRVW